MKMLNHFFCLLGVLALTVSVHASTFTEEEVTNSFGPKEVDTLPEPTKQVAPKLPPDLKGKRGLVRVAMLVDAKGEVVAPRIAQSSSPEFEEASIKAVKAWRFKPATKDGQPVTTRLSVPFRFK